MHDGAILNRRARSDRDRAVGLVAPNDGARPHRRLGPDAHRADHHGVGVDEGARVDVRRHVAEGSRGRLTAQEIREDGELFDRGYLDSLSYVEFLVFIEHTYRVRIDDSQLAGHLSTIAAMAEYILQEQTSPVE